MTTNGPKVSNGIVSNNPDFFTRADPDVNNKYRQVVRLDVGVGTAESLVSGSVGLPGNITQVGGVAVTLGQKAEAASVPVVLASEQDSVGVCADDFSNLYNFTAVAQYELGGTAPIPLTSLGGGSGGVKTYDITGNYSNIGVANTALPAGALNTRSFVAGINSSDPSFGKVAYVANTTPGASDTGLVTRNIPSGTQAVSGTVTIDSGLVTIDNGGGGSAVNIQDGGNSITVDGAVDVSGSTVDITNGPGANAMNIQDGGNSITVDGSVTADPSRPTSATPTRNAAITTAVDLLAAAATRRALFVYCESGAIYWRFGGTTTTTSYTGILNAGQSLQWTESCCTQAFNVLSVSGTSAALATEFTV